MRRTVFIAAGALFVAAISGCFSDGSQLEDLQIVPTALPTPSLSAGRSTPRGNPTESYLAVSPPGSYEKPIVIGVDSDDATHPEILDKYRDWAEQLSHATGLSLIVRPAWSTQMEAIEALNSGRIHIAHISALAYIFGHERGWLEPGAMGVFDAQSATAIMFVTRVDSSLIPGKSPDVLMQLESRRPCWPAQPLFPPLSEYILPSGLLALNSVETGPPVFVRNSLDAAVFQGRCDFAVMDALPAEIYKNLKPEELNDIPFERWAQEMQILYTTPPIKPTGVIAFSSILSVTMRDQLTRAVIETPGGDPKTFRFRQFDGSSYDAFRRIVAASGLNIQAYLGASGELSTAAVDSEWKIAPPGTLVVDTALQGGMPFLPGLSNQPLNRLVLPAIYAELLRLNARGEYTPYLAENAPTFENGLARFIGSGEDEQLEVEFHLRFGIRWQDNESLTADDLVFSWNLVMGPTWPGFHFGPVGFAPEVYVDSVESLAPNRVVYRFMSERQAREAARTGGKLNDPSIYADLAEQVGPVVPLDYLEVGRNVFPQHRLAEIPVEQIVNNDFARRPVYAGAYRLVEGGGDGEPVVLEAFDGFVLGKPRIKRIVFGAAYYSRAAEPYWQTPDKLAEAFEANAIQAQLSLPAIRSREGEDPSDYDALASQGIADVNWVPRDFWEVLDFNLDNPHLADLRVRRAIAHAIDRQSLIDEALAGHGSLMKSYLPAWHPLYADDSALPDYAYDLDRARELLEEAGYDLSQNPAAHPTRGPLVLRLASMDVASYPRRGMAKLIQEQLAQVGVQVEVKFYQWPRFEGEDCTAIRNGRQFDLGMAGWLGNRLYPLAWVEQTTASSSIPTPENGCPLEKANWSGWRDARADALVSQLKDGRLALERPEEYRQLWVEHQRLWASELPSLPLFNVERPVTVARRLEGVQPSPFAFGAVEDTWNIHIWRLLP